MNSAMWRIFFSSRALGLTSWCFYGLFKVVAKVVAAISFPLSAGLPIDSHLRYRSADSSESLPFCETNQKKPPLLLGSEQTGLDRPLRVLVSRCVSVTSSASGSDETSLPIVVKREP